MHRYSFFLLVLAAGLAVLGGFTMLAPAVKAEPMTQVMTAVPGTESWKAGFTVEGSAEYSNIVGRVLTDVASFRSAKVSDAYFIFPAAGSAKTITRFSYHILHRAGSYAGVVTMNLEVRNFDGSYVRTAAGSFNMKTASSGVWIWTTLSPNPENLVIQPGQFLCAHITADAGTSGDFVVQPMFEVVLH